MPGAIDLLARRGIAEAACREADLRTLERHGDLRGPRRARCIDAFERRARRSSERRGAVSVMVAVIEPRGWIAAVLNSVGMSAARLTPSIVKSVSLRADACLFGETSAANVHAPPCSEIRDSGRSTARLPTRSPDDCSTDAPGCTRRRSRGPWPCRSTDRPSVRTSRSRNRASLRRTGRSCRR